MEIAHGEINIDVRDREALAALNRLENEFDRSMDHIRREKAEAEAVLDTSQIDQEVKNTKRKLRELEARKAKLKVDGRAFKKVNAEIEATERNLKQLDGKQATMHLKVKGQDEILKAERRIAAAHAKEARLQEQRQAKAERIAAQSRARIAAAEKAAAAAAAQSERQRMAAIQRRSRVSASLRKQEAQEMRQAERAAYTMETARTRAEKAAAAAAAQSERQRMAAIQRRSRVSASLRKQEAQEMRQAERAAYTMETARTRAELAAKREAQLVPQLRSEYIKLARDVEAYDSKRRKAVRTRDPLAVAEVDINQEKALAKMQQIRDRLRHIGEPPPEIDLHISPGRDLGQTLRKTFKERGFTMAAWHGGQIASQKFSDGFKSRFNRENFSKQRMLEVLGGGLGRGASKIGGMLAGLSQATVRLGPFTATIRQALIGLSAFAPIIVDVVGALGSLISITGAGVAGLGALSAGFLGGAIPSALGFFAVLKPITGEFQNAMAASKAYNDALRKGNTDLAAKKLKELHATLGNVDKETVKNFKNAGRLRDSWTEATKTARASAFKVIGEGIKLAGDNMDWFAHRTNEGMDIAQKSVSRMIRGLGSAEGRNALSTMMDNFNRSLGPVLDGLANMGVYLGRVGRVASSFLPGFAGQFERWSKGLADGAADSDKLRDKITGVVDALRSVGRFGLAGGRLLKTFFGGGVDSGERFVDTMTNAMNRWTAFLGTTRGQQSLSNFFSRSVTGAQSLYAALAPIISSFVQWASALSPVVAGFLRGVGAVGNFTNSVLRLTGLRGPVTALAATLGTLWAVGRIGAAVQAVGNFTRAVLGLQAASTAATALGSATRGVAALEGAAAGGATRVGVLRAAATAAVPSIAGMGAAAGGAASLGIGLLAAGAAYGTYKLISMKSESEKTKDALANLSGPASASAKAFRTNAVAAADTGSALHHGRLQLKALKEQLDHTTPGTREHAEALLQVRDQVRFNASAERQWTTVKKNAANASRDQVKVERERKKLAKEIADEEDKYAKSVANSPGVVPSDEQEREHAKRLDGLRARQDALSAAAERAANRQAAVGINLTRAYNGLNPVLGRAEQSLGRLARLNKPLAQKIAVKYAAPKDVGKVSAAAGRALKAGVPKKVTTNIAVNSANAEQAVKRLQKARIRSISFRIVAQGGNTATRFLTRIQGTKLGNKVFKILASDASTRAKLRALAALGLPPKVLKMLGDNADALAKAAQANSQHLSTLNQIIQRAINNPANLFTNLPPVTQPVLRKLKGSLPGLATGGTGATPDANRMERAQREAGRAAVRDMRPGGRVSRPTMLVGEENKTEFVIATNPRYRERNIALLAAAARSLGVAGPREEDQGRLSRRLEGIDMLAPGGGGVGVRASGRKKRKKKKKKKAPRLNDVRGSTKKVLEWKQKEEDASRMASITESRLDEPDTFLYDSGRKAPDGNPIMEINWGLLANWENQMKAVRAWYYKQREAIAMIQTLVPKAIQEQKLTVEAAKSSIRNIDHDLKIQRGKSKSPNKAVARRASAAVSRLERRKQKQQDRKGKAQQNLEAMNEEQHDVKFRRLEVDALIAEYQEDIDAVRTRATKDKATANAPPSPGGSGDLSYGQQVAAAASEKMGVLRDFATNLNAPMGSGATAPSAASTDTPQKRMLASSMGSAIGSALVSSAPAASVGGAAIATLGSTVGGGSAAAAMASPTGSFAGAREAGSMASSDGGVAPSGDTTFNQYNTFDAPPPDPHTWSKGTEYEMGAIL